MADIVALNIDNLNNLSAKDCMNLAQNAEQCERFEDMVKAAKQMVKKSEDKISLDERNLLSVAYKNVVGSRRSAWRIFTALENKSRQNKSTDIKLIEDYKKTIKKELTNLCQDIINLLDSYIIDKDLYKDDYDSQVFFKKMKGDYYRYIAEVCDDEENDEERKDIVEKARKAYEGAYKASVESLPAHSPCRLGLALNYSVFYYEIVKNHDEACKLAKSAFDDAISVLDTTDDAESHKDSALILQLLRDNLTLWSDEEDKEDEDKNE